MAYIEESFDSSVDRNMRWKELKDIHYDVVCYSDVPKDSVDTETIKYIVAYPVNERIYE